MKRVLVGCAVLVLGLVLLVVGGYVVHGLIGMSEVRAAKVRAAQDVAAALPHAERQAARDQRQLRSHLGRGDPTYSWRELGCRWDTVDAGWIVQDYEQACVIHTVDLFAVAGPAAGPCDRRFRALGDLAGSTVTRGPASALERERPWERSCPSGILESPETVSRMLDGHRPGSLSASPAWVVAETLTPVSTTRVGCSAWGVIFCTAPFDEPVLPG